MLYCAVKNICGELTTGIISQGENEDFLLGQALQTKYDGKLLTVDDIVILTEKEALQRIENQSKPLQTPTLEERLQVAEDTINFLLGL